MVRTLSHVGRGEGEGKGERGDQTQQPEGPKVQKSWQPKWLGYIGLSNPAPLSWRSLGREGVCHPGGPCITGRTWGMKGEPGSQCSL